jgi:hypothetical protein
MLFVVLCVESIEGKLCLAESDDIVREIYAIGGRPKLFFYCPQSATPTRWTQKYRLFGQLTDFSEIWHAYHAN